MDLLKSAWTFLGIYQTKFVRIVHFLIILFVITQIITSNWMEISKNGIIDHQSYNFYFTWSHILIGISLLFLSLMLVVNCFYTKGVRYFFPYLWGDTKHIESDIRTLIKRKLPDMKPRGLAATVEGLGLGALLLVVLSGTLWFILWLFHSPYTYDVMQTHKSLTGLIEVYIVGHGFMGILHFISWKFL